MKALNLRYSEPLANLVMVNLNFDTPPKNSNKFMIALSTEEINEIK